MALAGRSVRLTSDKIEKIEDESVDAQIKHQARRVILKGSLAGLAMIALVMLIP